MKNIKASKLAIIKFKFAVLLSLLSFISNAQIIQVEIIGGSVVSQGATVTINAGNSLDFRITNIDGSNCDKLKIKGVDLSNTTDFEIDPGDPKKNIKHEDCNGNKKYLDFEIENISPNCTTTSTLVTIEIKNQSDFTFTLQVNSAPEIYVIGGCLLMLIFFMEIQQPLVLMVLILVL